jgi:hypothetical protein
MAPCCVASPTARLSVFIQLAHSATCGAKLRGPTLRIQLLCYLALHFLVSSPGARRLPTGRPSNRLGGKPPIGSHRQTYEGGSDPHCRGEEIKQVRGAALRSISSSCDTDRDFVHASVFLRACLSNTLHAGALAILLRLPRWNTTGVCLNREVTPHTIHPFVDRQATAESWRLPAVSGQKMPCPYHDVNMRVVRCCKNDTSGVENRLLSPPYGRKENT